MIVFSIFDYSLMKVWIFVIFFSGLFQFNQTLHNKINKPAKRLKHFLRGAFDALNSFSFFSKKISAVKRSLFCWGWCMFEFDGFLPQTQNILAKVTDNQKVTRDIIKFFVLFLLKFPNILSLDFRRKFGKVADSTVANKPGITKVSVFLEKKVITKCNGWRKSYAW